MKIKCDLCSTPFYKREARIKKHNFCTYAHYVRYVRLHGILYTPKKQVIRKISTPWTDLETYTKQCRESERRNAHTR